jgi:hypothetical protein
MDDSTVPIDRPTDPICPWCSAAVAVDAAVCPSCAAILLSDEEHEVPGLTAVDEAIVRGEKRPGQGRRLFSWISGGYEVDDATGAEVIPDAAAIAPPAPDVEREILRLELEAEVANLQAEADSAMADAMVEGRAIDVPDDLLSLVTVETEDGPEGETPA